MVVHAVHVFVRLLSQKRPMKKTTTTTKAALRFYNIFDPQIFGADFDSLKVLSNICSSFFLSPTTIVVVVVVVVVVVSPKICRGFVNMCEDRRESFSGGTERPSLYRLLFASLSLSPLSRLVCFLQRIAKHYMSFFHVCFTQNKNRRLNCSMTICTLNKEAVSNNWLSTDLD